MVAALLAKGANVNIRASDDSTPLQDAIRRLEEDSTLEGHKNTAEFILNHYARTFGGRFDIIRDEKAKWMCNYTPESGMEIHMPLASSQNVINQINEMRDQVPAETSFEYRGFRFTFGPDKKITNIEKID